MKILPITTSQYNHYSFIKSSTNVAFTKNWTLKDVFLKNKIDNEVKDIKGIIEGEYGTQCKGSIPLHDFTKIFPYECNKKLYKKGLSTNVNGNAYSLLKAKLDVPLSTSRVYDCSVMYLCNENTNTHFLYHMYSDVDKKEITNIIKSFMQEGYTKAALVPGDKFWTDKHRRYLPEVFQAIKENGNGAKIKIYHNSTLHPEIVCYKGNVYEIPLSDTDECSTMFKIKDWYSYDILDYIEMTTLENNIEAIREKLYSKNYNSELLEALDIILVDRLVMLGQIKNIKTLDELKSFIKINQRDQYFNRKYILPLTEKMDELLYQQYGKIPESHKLLFSCMRDED